MLAALERSLGVQNLGARRDRHDDLARERLRGARGHAGAQSVGDQQAPGLVHVPHEWYDAAGDEHPRGLGAVHAAADDGVGGRLRTAQRVRGKHSRRGCAERRHGGGVEHCEKPAVLGVRQEHEPGHGGEAARRVPGERRDPLEKCVAVADGGHGAEVPGRVVRDVDLRRHRPRRSGMRLECGANRIVRVVWRDGPLDVGGSEDRDHRVSLRGGETLDQIVPRRATPTPPSRP